MTRHVDAGLAGIGPSLVNAGLGLHRLRPRGSLRSAVLAGQRGVLKGITKPTDGSRRRCHPSPHADGGLVAGTKLRKKGPQTVGVRVTKGMKNKGSFTIFVDVVCVSQ